MQAKWAEGILEEVAVALRKKPLVSALELPDPGDRHVLAAAIKAKAQIIVTKNLRDFPAERLAPWDLKAKSPDSFVRDQIDIDRQAVWACVQQIVDSRTRNPMTIEDVPKQVERDGLVGSVTVLPMS